MPMMTLAQLDSGWPVAGAALALGLAGLVLLGRAMRHLRRTTLVGPGCWAGVSLLALSGSEVAGALAPVAGDSSWGVLIRYVAATTVFCPTIALLGAKRPQHRAWHFIVGSFWGLLAIPAVETLLFRTGEPLHVPTLWAWLMLLLMLLGVANHGPTRFWPSCLLVFLGQYALVGRHLPLIPAPIIEPAPLVSLGCFDLALGLAWVGARFSSKRRGKTPLDRLWWDFRNMYGVLWSLRVAERVNAAMQTTAIPAALGWNGPFLTDDGAEMSPEVIEAISRVLRSLLGRFVSAEWIARRLDGP